MIGKNIKTLRQLKQINQQELAVALDMKQSTIANYEKDTRTPNLDTLLLLADYFGITLDELVGREEETYDDMIALSDRFLNYLLNDDLEKADALVNKLLLSQDVTTVYFKLFRYTLSKLGWLWEVNAITIAKEHQISYEISRMISQISNNYKKANLVKANRVKILGMAAPGEKHNIGLKMTLSSLEFNGFESLYIGEAVPTEDLLEHLKRDRYKYLILSITNIHLNEKLAELIKALPEIKIYVTGSGTMAINDNRVKVFKSYETCLEALLWQEKILTKEM